MAHATGTSANHVDLLGDLVTFLTTDSDLVTAGHNWVVEHDGRFERKAAYTGRIAWDTYASGSANTTMPDDPPAYVPGFETLWVCHGTLVCPSPGTYDFALDCKGWAQLLIDGAEVVARYAATSALNAFSLTGSVALSSGDHTIEVRLGSNFNPAGSASRAMGVGIGWQKPGDVTYTLIPAGNLEDMTHEWQPLVVTTMPSVADDFDRLFTSRNVIVVGPGPAADKEIIVRLGTYSDPAADKDALRLHYGVGTNDEGLIGASSGDKWMPLWDSTIDYHFIANGSRFAVVAKVSTTQTACYAGFALPLAMPDEWPYPLTIGATCGQFRRYSDTSAVDYRHFWSPRAATTGNPLVSGLSMRHPGGDEIGFDNNTSVNPNTAPYFGTPALRPAVAGNYMLTPITLFDQSSGNTYATFDGVFHVTGHGLSGDDVIEAGGVEHLVVAGVPAVGIGGYAAFALE